MRKLIEQRIAREIELAPMDYQIHLASKQLKVKRAAAESLAAEVVIGLFALPGFRDALVD